MGLGSAAADSLTSGNRNLSQAYTNSSTAPWPCHGSPLGWQGAPANTPSLAAPIEQHSTAGSRGSHGQALLRLMQGLSPSPYGCTARLAGSQEPQHAAAPSPESPRDTAAQRLCPDTARIHGAAGPGQCGGKSSPRVANKTGIQGRVQAPALAGPGTWHFPARAHSVGLVVTKCTRHAAPMQGQLFQPACAGHGTAKGTGTCPGGRSQVPCPTKRLACPSMSCCPHCVPLSAETRGSPVVAVRAAAKDCSEGGR